MNHSRFELSLRHALVLLFALAMVGVTVTEAGAVPISYPDVMGATVWFRDIEEDSTTDPLPLYGPPSVGGDTLDFNPIDFEADSAGGSPMDTTAGTLTMTIEAKPGQFITQMTINERGDYTTTGFGGAGTFASVTANITIAVLEINGFPAPPTIFAETMDMTPSDGDFDLLNDGQATNVIWSGMKTVDIAAVVSNVTKVSFIFDNTLTAKSETNSTALIAKKDFGGTSITVPEPAGAALLLAAAACIFSRRQRT